MILEYKDCTRLKQTPWFMLEIRSENTIESTLRRVGKSIPGIFRNDPIEVFIPVVKRDLDCFEMATGPYIFVRSCNFNSLLRLKSVTGCVGLVTISDSQRPSQAISVEDSYVQGLIAQAEEKHRISAIDIEVNSFVRVLSGGTRDFCGIVEMIDNGRAVVRITLCTKTILLETPIRNLLNLSQVPKEQRVYYYSPLVEELFKDAPDATYMVEEDLHINEPTPSEYIEETQIEEPEKHSRQRTVTALVKKLILIEGLHNPMQIARKVVTAIKKKEIKATKNLFIIYALIKDHLRLDYFSKIDPSIHNYREVIRKYGREYKFSTAQIAKIDLDLGIPQNTVEVCKDGRSREARQKSKNQRTEIKAFKQKIKRQKKQPTDKCNECYHERREHKLSPKGAWMRCTGISHHTIHSWVKNKDQKPCWCRRFKELSKKVILKTN